ncbi:hypothetical protein GCM10019016_050630 [Streptomyces prasinosporus]|uniref:Uncharacterized protein n=1 Tax=Streptomyces prasinosporus TaxID=68256 RepID=A0ABP6TT61_9ACTN
MPPGPDRFLRKCQEAVRTGAGRVRKGGARIAFQQVMGVTAARARKSARRVRGTAVNG